jgi:steroid 5-alpha reductase family enzyme
VVFVLGQATQNASWVDRLWAFLPLIYSAHFAFQGRWSGAGSVSQLFGSKEVNPQTQGWSAFVPAGVDERMFILVLLQILWSLRLNGNTLRRGFFDITYVELSLQSVLLK